MTNPAIKKVMLSLFLGILATLASFLVAVHTDNASAICNGTVSATEELRISSSTLNDRGFPIWYYQPGLPANCSIVDTGDADVSSHFRKIAFGEDFVLWSAVSLGTVFGISKIRRRK